MRHKVLVTSMLAALLFFTGCMRSMTSSKYHPDDTRMSVRFVLPSEQELYTGADARTDAQLVVDSAYEGFSGWDGRVETTDFSPGAYHVAIWGGPYDGVDVTTRRTSLEPGSYTFAYFDHPHDMLMQGWLDVRNAGSNLLSVLTKWRDGIPEQKERLAYELEIDGRMDDSDPGVFKSFRKQIQAYNILERQLENMINTERRALTNRRGEVRDLLGSADVVIMPGQDSFFRSTTQPAFSEDDLTAVRDGHVVTKVVLAADYREAHWKLRQLDQLYDDLSRFKVVLREEVDRLERRKGLFLLTDHLHKHDKKFVENETRLQYTLGMIDRFNRHTSDLRERRMALAFVSSLFCPDVDFTELDREQSDLRRERSVLEAQRQRLDQMIDEIDENSFRWVTHERSRQDTLAAIEEIDNQIGNIELAKIALVDMFDSTEVIHRHNDMRLLATSFVSSQLPLNVRQAVEREAMMTVRLQKSDKVFAPRPTSVAYADYYAPYYTNEPFLNDENRVSYVEPTRQDWDHTATVTYHNDEDRESYVEPTRQYSDHTATVDYHSDADRESHFEPTRQDSDHTATMDYQNDADRESYVEPTRQDWDHTATVDYHNDADRESYVEPTRQDSDHTSKMVYRNDEGRVSYVEPTKQDSDRTSKMVYRNDEGRVSYVEPTRQDSDHTATLTHYPQEPTTRTQDRQDYVQSKPKRKSCSLPLFFKVLVPPCWFVDDSDSSQDYTAKRPKDNRKPKTKLAQYREKDKSCKSGCTLPWFIKMLVPPCWFVDDVRPSQDCTAKRPADNRKPKARLAQYREKDKSCKSGCSLPWLIKLFVPPCWFVDDVCPSQDCTTKRPADNRKPKAKLAQYREKDKSCKSGCGLPFFFKLLVPPCWFVGDVCLSQNCAAERPDNNRNR